MAVSRGKFGPKGTVGMVVFFLVLVGFALIRPALYAAILPGRLEACVSSMQAEALACDDHRLPGEVDLGTCTDLIPSELFGLPSTSPWESDTPQGRGSGKTCADYGEQQLCNLCEGVQMTQVGGACSITNICNPGSYTCIEGGVAGARSCVNDNECGRGGNMICSNSTCMDAGGTNTQRNMGGGDRDGADGDVTRGGVCAASTECAGTDVCDTDECGNIVNKPGCDCYDGTKYKAHWQCPSGDQLYANGGMTATDACCVCGGGSTPLIDAATCTASAAACVALDGCAHSKTQMMSIVIVVLGIVVMAGGFAWAVFTGKGHEVGRMTGRAGWTSGGGGTISANVVHNAAKHNPNVVANPLNTAGQTMQVAVPEGVAPGQMVMVSTRGGQMQVAVPAGLVPGQMFQVIVAE